MAAFKAVTKSQKGPKHFLFSCTENGLFLQLAASYFVTALVETPHNIKTPYKGSLISEGFSLCLKLKKKSCQITRP